MSETGGKWLLDKEKAWEAAEEEELQETSGGCQDLVDKWTYGTSDKQGIHRENFTHCLLGLSATDQGWGHHVLCAHTKAEMAGWKAAMDLHRWAYSGVEREEDQALSQLLAKEMAAAEDTMQQVLYRADEKRNSDTESTGGDEQDEDQSAILSEVDGEFLTEKIALENTARGSFIERKSTVASEVTSKQKMIAASKAAVESAAAMCTRALDLVEHDKENVHDAVEFFQQAFLKAHAHVQFLKEHVSTFSDHHAESDHHVEDEVHFHHCCRRRRRGHYSNY
eukprot:gnl/TRDRNA2_/TRDRNA2_140302_c0_seq1.p1 gnl/TRDRNA2_/TRDRNA2_140302_c0~~gnl/TRDRNA2_/TRDRNA2_140302_c0_seq1.p1  ORF type:complete len:297 (-),score=68.78 gnl/TRDRNA2_/TRDRNA2_140302_c0_seq1:314-1153(-)